MYEGYYIDDEFFPLRRNNLKVKTDADSCRFCILTRGSSLLGALRISQHQCFDFSLELLGPAEIRHQLLPSLQQYREQFGSYDDNAAAAE